jgi:hypothetical protein
VTAPENPREETRQATATAPDAELLIAPGCVHCPVVLGALAELVKRGQIGRLTVVNIAAHPDEAERRGVRGVPWIRLGAFELQGAHSQSELADWAARAAAPGAAAGYLRELLETGQLDSVTGACRRNPAALLAALIDLAGDLDTPFAVRVGVGAVLEDLARTGLPAEALPALQRLAASEHPQVRADAAHFLGLEGSPAAAQTLARLVQDPDPEVREIAAESLAGPDAGED